MNSDASSESAPALRTSKNAKRDGCLAFHRLLDNTVLRFQRMDMAHHRPARFVGEGRTRLGSVGRIDLIAPHARSRDARDAMKRSTVYPDRSTWGIAPWNRTIRARHGADLFADEPKDSRPQPSGPRIRE